MSEMLKLYVRGGFEFVDEDTGFTTSDFGGAPNPLEYIDLADFGADLISTGDTTICRELPNGKVVTTSYGW